MEMLGWAVAVAGVAALLYLGKRWWDKRQAAKAVEPK